MALRFRCECGETLDAEDGAVARRITCPACGRKVTVPANPGRETACSNKYPDKSTPHPQYPRRAAETL